MIRHIPTLILTLTLAGCSGGQAPPTPATTPAAAATSAAAPAADGEKLFTQNCSACHGMDGTGVAGLGKPLVGSPMLKLKDPELVAFINQGRDTSDKANTTGVAMPPKGGNPALSDQNLQEIVTYIRSLK